VKSIKDMLDKNVFIVGTPFEGQIEQMVDYTYKDLNEIEENGMLDDMEPQEYVFEVTIKKVYAKKSETQFEEIK
jgi:hypothetical protein